MKLNMYCTLKVIPYINYLRNAFDFFKTIIQVFNEFNRIFLLFKNLDLESRRNSIFKFQIEMLFWKIVGKVYSSLTFYYFFLTIFLKKSMALNIYFFNFTKK